MLFYKFYFYNINPFPSVNANIYKVSAPTTHDITHNDCVFASSYSALNTVQQKIS